MERINQFGITFVQATTKKIGQERGYTQTLNASGSAIRYELVFYECQTKNVVKVEEGLAGIAHLGEVEPCARPTSQSAQSIPWVHRVEQSSKPSWRINWASWTLRR